MVLSLRNPARSIVGDEAGCRAVSEISYESDSFGRVYGRCWRCCSQGDQMRGPDMLWEEVLVRH